MEDASCSLGHFRMILNYEKIKKEKSHKLQAASLTISLGYCKIVFYCNVKLNYLLQRLTSFSVFPVDKFVKALFGQVVMTGESQC